MSLITEKDWRQFTFVRIIAFAMFIGAPFCYFVIASRIRDDIFQASEQATLVMYILLPMALVDPLLWYLIKRSVIANLAKQSEEKPLSERYQILMIIKMALVEAIFIYGLVVFFLTHETMNLLWFYLIGTVWAVVFWPRKSHFERVMNDGLEVL